MSKRIVVCSDGTWNTPSQKNPTNVVKVARAILPRDPDGVEQVVFYDAGVGTGGLVDRITGGGLGKGLEQNIEDNYRFLVHNFVPGDTIYLLGFSRGAYTARSTAGLIRNSGILRKEHAGRIGEALDLYRSRSIEPKSSQAEEFRQRYSHVTGIEFIGVWDTVGALGIPDAGPLTRWLGRRRGAHAFHDTALSSTVGNAFHAVSIDERRKAFRPTLWDETKQVEGQRLEQVWFAGVHSDVGGGYGDDRLADVALAWMLDRAEECDLAIDRGALEINASYAGKLHDSMKWLFRPFGAHIRAVSGNVDQSVEERARDRACEYQPENLLAARPDLATGPEA